jgi:hypothetical protein
LDTKLNIIRDISIIAFIIFAIYIIYNLIKQQQAIISINNNNNANATTSAPTTFKNTMNIYIWLQDINDYFNLKNIKKEEDK